MALQHAVSSRPLLLMLDGHSSHYMLELVKLAAENSVVIICLPPHPTADSQPLDTSCFGPLKVYWSGRCRRFMFSNHGRVVSKFQFFKLFSQAWSNDMITDNVTSGFRTSGVYPFIPKAILDKLPASDHPSHVGNSGDGDSSSGNPPVSAKHNWRNQMIHFLHQTILQRICQRIRHFHHHFPVSH